MDTISDNVSLDEFLVTVNARDVVQSFIAPGPDVAQRITREIEAKTGIKSNNLSTQPVIEVRKWVSARPGQFITEARIAFDSMCALLEHQNAQCFQVAFHNTQDHLNYWGDRILFAIRYQCPA